MRIHTALDEGTIRQAIRAAGCTVERLHRHRSRSHAGSFDVILSGSSPRQGQGGGYRAATWDEWGVFLAAIFARDPGAKAGSAYLNRDHFEWSTGYRYGPTFDLAGQHRQHAFRWEGDAVTGSYSVHRCAAERAGEGCTAIRRYLTQGTPWSVISGEDDAATSSPDDDDDDRAVYVPRGSFEYHGAYSVPEGHYAAEFLAGIGS